MPKTSHGPEPKAAPPSLLVMLRGLRGRVDFNALENERYFENCFDRAGELEARLDELHDAVEYAVEHLNRVTAEDDGTFASSDDLQVALARLNRVL